MEDRGSQPRVCLEPMRLAIHEAPEQRFEVEGGLGVRHDPHGVSASEHRIDHLKGIRQALLTNGVQESRVRLDAYSRGGEPLRQRVNPVRFPIEAIPVCDTLLPIGDQKQPADERRLVRVLTVKSVDPRSADGAVSEALPQRPERIVGTTVRSQDQFVNEVRHLPRLVQYQVDERPDQGERLRLRQLEREPRDLA